MKIVISGSLGNVGKPLAERLVSDHDITVISSNKDRRAAIEAIGATPAIGSVLDAGFLKATFRNADTIFAMTPPQIAASSIVATTIDAGKAFAAAVKEAGVKRLVMLSSIGADVPHGTGPVTALHEIEKLYAELDTVSVTFLRAGSLYSNFYEDIPMIREMNIMGANYPATCKVPLAHARDIAAAAAEELQKTPASRKEVRYIVSDVRTPADFTRVLGTAIGKPGLSWVEFTDEEALAGLLAAGLPKELAELYIELGAGFRDDSIQTDFGRNGGSVNGKIRLEDFSKEFAGEYARVN